MDTQKELTSDTDSKIKKYQKLVVGSEGRGKLIRYELSQLFTSWVPGALGLFLRSKLYPQVLRKCGKNVAFGTNVVLRHPHKISIGDNVIIDDNSVLDAKGFDNAGIFLGQRVFIGRNSILYCQNGNIKIDDHANIGSNCQVFSAKSVMIGKKVLIGAYSYLIGGGHRFNDLTIPIIDQDRIAIGITVGDDVWVGAAVKIMDGVNVGRSSILGTGAVVIEDVPSYAVVGGIPAKVLRDRRDQKAN